MIITRTPYRISFFGGGTDYPEWYQQYGGAVLATSIDKYCYINCRFLPPFFENHKTRVVWSVVEEVNKTSEIVHPAVRNILEYLKIEDGLEIHHDGDLPARSGLGSSSAFTVGLLNALYAHYGSMVSKQDLSHLAIFIEKNVMKENVGVQDQIATAYGGFNHVSLDYGGRYSLKPMILPPQRQSILENSLLLFYTGIVRTASDIAEAQIKTMNDNKDQMHLIASMVPEAVNILQSRGDLDDFGRLLHESWLIKRSLTDKITNDTIDEIYLKARKAGALGGKILGAGGGGFMLFYVPMPKQRSVLKALSHLTHVPFNFENEGSKVIFYNPEKSQNIIQNNIISMTREAIA